MSKKGKGKGRVPKNMSEIVQKVLDRNFEIKFFDQTQTASLLSYAGTLFTLSNVGQGDTFATRDGDRMKIKWLQMNLSFVLGSSSYLCRVIILQWRPSTSIGNPTATNILNVTGQAEAVNSSYNQQFCGPGKQAVILLDKTFVIPPSGSIICVKPWLNKKITGGFSPLQQFIAGGTTGSNQLYMLAISDTAANGPSVRFVSQVAFTDA
jgi:hypothetical protein